MSNGTLVGTRPLFPANGRKGKGDVGQHVVEITLLGVNEPAQFVQLFRAMPTVE